MSFWLITKIALVVLFLFMFWRRADWVWGIGLLTLATAAFADTFLGVFGRAELVAQLGLMAYVLGGVLVGGTAVWFIGVTRPLWMPPAAIPPVVAVPPQGAAVAVAPLGREQQELYETIRTKLSGDDILDLIFDLNLNESDILSPTRDMTQTIHNLLHAAQQKGGTADVALAVERVLTPVPAEHLPRLEKLSAETPPTVLRRYLLAYYFADQLREMAQALGIDWELLGLGSKQAKTRNLLLYLRRRGRTAELIALMKGEGG